MPGFILQGGDPTGTGSGGESIYDGGEFAEENGIWPMEERKGQNAGSRGVGFKDEFHSRIKFNRRGLLGMANEGKDTNGSQFFLTLGDTPELTGKNTMFGRVEGETIYNLARMGEAECVDGERPLYPAKITGVEILVNPFKDMVRRERIAKVAVPEEKAPEKKKKRKAGKQLLSFGDDGEEGVEEPIIKKKAKFDTRIVMDDGSAENEAQPEAKAKSMPKKKAPKTRSSISPQSSAEPEARAPPKLLPNRAAKLDRDISSSPEPQVEKVTSLLDRTNAQIAELKASMKRNVQTAPEPEKQKSALEAMIPATSVRGRKRKPNGNGRSTNDQAALDILRAFREKLESAPPEKEVVKAVPQDDGKANASENGTADDEEAALCDLHFIANCQSCQTWENKGEEEEDDDINDKGWMSHALSFKEDKLGKDLSYRKKAEDELVVIDPREKAKTLKEEMKAKREARAGGSTGREWDAKRNEKLARSSALAGRGAK